MQQDFENFDTKPVDAEAPRQPEQGEQPKPAPLPGSSIPPEELERLSNDIVAALKTVYDPEIPADIYELGLIYRVDIADDRQVTIDMTLTAPGCPVAGEMPGWVENAVSTVQGVASVTVNMTFDPPWDQSRMSDEARVALDMW
jgi:FeS assembly SUF system protein